MSYVFRRLQVPDGHMQVQYYLHCLCHARSVRAREAARSSRDAPWVCPLPAAAARSSLLSAPTTGASVPTKTNSVVQPSVHPLPLAEPLPSSPAESHRQMPRWP